MGGRGEEEDVDSISSDPKSVSQVGRRGKREERETIKKQNQRKNRGMARRHSHNSISISEPGRHPISRGIIHPDTKCRH